MNAWKNQDYFLKPNETMQRFRGHNGCIRVRSKKEKWLKEKEQRLRVKMPQVFEKQKERLRIRDRSFRAKLD